MTFKDRKEAGEMLAQSLLRYKWKEAVVIAIPRGGVILGAEIAERLGAPMDIIIVRKVGHPDNPEYAICVVAEDQHEVCNESEVAKIDQIWLKEAKQKARTEAKRRRVEYLGERPRPPITGKTAIVVDDGIATGMTFIAALRQAREMKPSKLVAAVPVMPAQFMGNLKKECDEVVCLNIDADYLGAVGAYYENFPQVSDMEVKKIMRAV